MQPTDCLILTLESPEENKRRWCREKQELKAVGTVSLFERLRTRTICQKRLRSNTVQTSSKEDAVTLWATTYMHPNNNCNYCTGWQLKTINTGMKQASRKSIGRTVDILNIDNARGSSQNVPYLESIVCLQVLLAWRWTSRKNTTIKKYGQDQQFHPETPFRQVKFCQQPSSP